MSAPWREKYQTDRERLGLGNRTSNWGSVSMTRRDWWFGVSLLALAISIHAMVPRYVWTHVQGRTYSRTDRWTGDLQLWVGSYDTLKRVVAITPAQHEGEGLDPLWHS